MRFHHRCLDDLITGLVAQEYAHCVHPLIELDAERMAYLNLLHNYYSSRSPEWCKSYKKDVIQYFKQLVGEILDRNQSPMIFYEDQPLLPFAIDDSVWSEVADAELFANRIDHYDKQYRNVADPGVRDSFLIELSRDIQSRIPKFHKMDTGPWGDESSVN